MRSDQRHYLAAIDAFEHALALDPSAADAYRHLATVYRRQGNAPRAEDTYRQAIARQPEYWKGYNLLGVFYYTQGRYDEAVAQYTHGLRLAPANPALLNNLAVAYWTTHRLGEAMSVFERLVALDSTRASARSNLATAYFYLGRFDEAAALYARSLADDPNDYATAGALADAQTWSGSPPGSAQASYRRAIDLAQTHLSVRNQDPDLLGSLAQFYVRIQQPDSARIWLRRLEAVVDSSTAGVVTAFTVGELYESLGERDRAWAWMQPALDRGYGWIQMAYSPWLADLRTDPGVATILRSHPLADSLFASPSAGDRPPGPSPPDR
jgi:tetratricopeptide (TPR) repeat protein